MIVSRNISDRIVELMKNIKGAKVATCKEVCQDELSFLRGKYKINYIVTCLTAYRKEAQRVNKKAVKFLDINDLEKKERKIESAISEQSKRIEQKKVKDYLGMIETSIQLLDSEKYYDIALGLCLLTGRRLTEILKTANFSNYKNHKNMLHFGGQLKKRGKVGKYPVYTIADSKKCKVALARMRELINIGKVKKVEDMENKEVERKYHKTVNQKATKYFGKYIGRCTAHKLRAVYAIICLELFNSSGMEDNMFLGQLMGHEKDDYDTIKHYRRYELDK